MLLIKNYIAPSTIEGLGCFAGEDIPKGTPVWRFDSEFDMVLPLGKYEQLPSVAKEFMDRYAYELKEVPGRILLESDSARFFNHSRDPNVGEPEKFSEAVALRDIKKGEELTCDYRKYEHDQVASWM